MSVPDEILSGFAKLATPTIANALDDVAFEGSCRVSRRWCPARAAWGGPSLCARSPGKRGDFTSSDFKVGQMIDAPAPGDILVIDNGGHCVSTFGGLATLAAKVKGIGGLVADGGVRDREEMLEHAFPVFARHMTPLTGRTRLAITGINETVACGGVRVRAGRRHRRRRLGRGVHPRRACRARSLELAHGATAATTSRPPASSPRA